MKQTEGFTFIEILVVVALVGIIMTGIVGMLLSVLRSSRKNEVMTNLKQAGDQAMVSMSGIIRNAKEISGCDPTLEITNSAGETETFTCNLSGDEKINSSIRGDLISSGVTTCSFTCPLANEAGTFDSVTINFELSSGSENDPTSHVKAVFETTISLRNY